MLNVVLNGCETLSFTLGREYLLQMCGNLVLRRIFKPKRGDVGNYVMEIFTVCTLHQQGKTLFTLILCKPITFRLYCSVSGSMQDQPVGNYE
jgi:hypothetical protein